MPDPFGITDGVKAVTSSINESVKASKELSKAIDGVLELADAAAKDRTAARKKLDRLILIPQRLLKQ